LDFSAAKRLRAFTKNRIHINAATVLLGNGTGALLSLVALAGAARVVAPAELGAILVAQSYAALVVRVCTPQTPFAILRLGAKGIFAKSNGDVRNILITAAILDGAAGLLATVLGFVLISPVAAIANWNEATSAAASIYVITALCTLASTATGVLRLFDKFGRLAVYRALAPAIRCVAVLMITLHVERTSRLLNWWVFSELAGAAVVLVLASAELWRQRVLAVNGRIQLSGEVLRFSLITGAHTTLKSITKDVDVLVVNAVGGPSGAAIYKFARQLAATVNQFTDAIAQAIVPELTRLAVREQWIRFEGLVWQCICAGAACGVLVFTCSLLWGARVLELVGTASYGTGYSVLLLATAANAIALTFFVLQPATVAIGQPKLGLKSIIVSTMCYGAALYPLSKAYGLAGPALAYLIFYMMWAATLASGLNKELKTYLSESNNTNAYAI